MSSPSPTEPRYLKRFRMEVELRDAPLERPRLPEGYEWVAWHPATLPEHARTKFESFRDELDCQIFPCLRSYQGCLDLMQSIMTHRGFLPEATWMIRQIADEERPTQESLLRPLASGVIQGISQSTTLGAIQNIGVIPACRGLGLGRALLLRALHGFRAYGLLRVYLDVSAENTSAIALYRSLGFRYQKTSYREVIPEK